MNSRPAPSLGFQDAANYTSRDAKAGKANTQVKLELYGLFKFVTVSAEPNSGRPSIFDPTGRAKWDAWSKVSKEWSDKSLSEAEARYMQIAKDLGWEEGQAFTQPVELGKRDEEGGSSGGESGGMGLTVSSIQKPPEELEVDDTSLHGVVLVNNSEKVSAFLKSHPETNIDGTDVYGFTALHLAADRGFTEVVKTLLESGANIGVKDPDDLTAISLARAANHEDIVVLLENKLAASGTIGQGA